MSAPAPPVFAPPPPIPVEAQPSRLRSYVSYLKWVALAMLLAGGYVGYVRYERWQPYEWSGSVEARTVAVGSRVGGRVKAVLVHEGQHVQKGDVLIQLESGEIEGRRLVAQAEVEAAEAVYEKLSNGAQPAEIAAAYARLAAARAAADQAYTAASHESVELGRAKALFSSGSLSTSEHHAAVTRTRVAGATLSQAAARAKEEEAALKLLTQGTRPEDIRAARAQLAVARAKLAQVDQQLEESSVRAPNAARVESIPVRPGDILKVDAHAATLLEAGQLYVRIYVPEPHLGKVAVGQQVAVTVDSFPNRTFKARIDHINEVGEFTPRRLVTTEERAEEVFGARLALLEGDAELRAGMAAFIHVPKK
jgi:HlyD family secretion protein